MVDSEAMYGVAPKKPDQEHHRHHAGGHTKGPPSSSSALPPQFDKPPLTARIHKLIKEGRLDLTHTKISELNFRPLRSSDYEEVESLHNEWFPVHYDGAFFTAATNGDCYSLAATVPLPAGSVSEREDSDAILGIITVSTGRTAQTENPDTFLEIMRHNTDFFSTVTSHEQSLAYMLTLGTADEARGRGLASELVLRALAEVKRQYPDCGAMYLHVIDYNTAAIRMYEKIGFRCVGFHKGFYTIDGEPYDAYTYAYYYPPAILPVSVYTGLSWFRPLFSTVRSSFRSFVNSTPTEQQPKTPPRIDKPD
ncbi:N(alpha)-acetyltransferase 60, NatF catalytic subunit [Perkinsus olseni]|uniref:N-alpha-acetyltransferase 60 n=2 Tax=Perkinsus olseni TaxID=32597 RepID=A0A7J6MMP0_PEROL|nr:N(alpha)-acetyltransferase 60, NatF catalytic subunit [Perkinsus olseni]